MSIDYTKLREPFDSSDIEWRIQKAGINNDKAWGTVIAYITNRAIQQRLDTVVEPQNWQNKYSEAPDKGVLCGISIFDNDRWVTKYDGAENTKVESVKGGLSGSMKRAAVQWGIGRYLYDVETMFVSMQKEKPADMKDWHMHFDKDTNTRYYWKSPSLPTWAMAEKDSSIEIGKIKEEIKKIALSIGTPERNVDLRLSEIVTASEAQAALKKLKGEL